MEQIQGVQISLEGFRFYGYSFDPEILHHMMDLEIDEIYELTYRKFESEDILTWDVNEIGFKDVIDLLLMFEGHSCLYSLSLRFTNGLFFSFYEGVVKFQIDDEKLFLHYCTTILKQYGCFPEKIFELSRLHPGKELLIERPGVLFKIREPYSEEGVSPVDGK